MPLFPLPLQMCILLLPLLYSCACCQGLHDAKHAEVDVCHSISRGVWRD